MALTAHTLDTQIRKTVHIQYLLHLPEQYEASSDKKWPVLLFLHGAGERGDDLDKVKVHGPPKLADHADLPFIIIAPQCQEHSHWQLEMDAVIALLDEVTAAYRADTDRIYVTGIKHGRIRNLEPGDSLPGSVRGAGADLRGQQPAAGLAVEAGSGLGIPWGERYGRSAKPIGSDG